MRRIFGFLLIPALLTGLVWLAVVIYLQQSQADIDGADLVGGFVLAPLALIALWFGGKALFAWYTRPAAAANTSVAASPAITAAPPAPESQPLNILSAEVLTVAGEDGEQLTDIRAGKTQPALSDTYLDENGLPIFAALHTDLDIDEARQWLERWLSNTAPEHPAHQAEAALGARLLSLLASPLRRSLDTLNTLPPLAVQPNARADQAKPVRPIHLKIFAPAVWQDMLQAYVREQIAPLEGFALGIIRPNPQHPEQQHDAIRIAKAFSSDPQQTQADSLLLMLACDSQGSELQIDGLAQQARLFTPENQTGTIPGEAAVAVLAMSARQTPPDIEALATLSSYASGMRQKPIDGGGRSDADLLLAMLPSVLRREDTGLHDVSCMISDCDHRNAWNAESAILISTQLPALDPVADHLAIGRALGFTGHASSLLALAFAALYARDEARPVLNASLAHPAHRSLAVLCPWQPSLT